MPDWMKKYLMASAAFYAPPDEGNEGADEAREENGDEGEGAESAGQDEEAGSEGVGDENADAEGEEGRGRSAGAAAESGCNRASRPSPIPSRKKRRNGSGSTGNWLGYAPPSGSEAPAISAGNPRGESHKAGPDGPRGRDAGRLEESRRPDPEFAAPAGIADTGDERQADLQRRSTRRPASQEVRCGGREDQAGAKVHEAFFVPREVLLDLAIGRAARAAATKTGAESPAGRPAQDCCAGVQTGRSPRRYGDPTRAPGG